jgi:hypothetical protein
MEHINVTTPVEQLDLPTHGPTTLDFVREGLYLDGQRLP